MGKYSVHGSAEFDALIDAHMERIAEVVYGSIYSKHWKALVLFGGYGRGEGTPLIQGSGVRSQGSEVGGQGSDVEQPFNDYGFLVVTNLLDPLVKRSLKKMGNTLSEELGLLVVLRPCLERSLKRSDFTLSNYEIKQGHRVVRGDENILSKMPDIPPDRIPLSEGTRLLMNRGKRLLEMKQRMSSGKPLTHEEHHLFIKYIFKAHLAFGDCALLLRGVYDISTAVRKKRIEEIALNSLPEGRDIAGAYRRAIDFKDRACFRPLETVNLHVWLDETVRHFKEVFLWYERRRLNRKFRSPKKYAHAFPNLGKEGAALSNAAHNLRAFGPLGPAALFSHPRLRLYAALPLLLATHTNHEEIRWILHSHQSTLEGLCEEFDSLHQKFS